MPLGWLVSVLILAPNVLWIRYPPVAPPPVAPASPSPLARLMEAMERVGQVSAFVIPFFSSVEIEGASTIVALIVMTIALACYYAGWARYFLHGRAYRLLYAPLAIVPLPMVISPVLFFMAASLFLRSWPLAIAALILGIGHLYVSNTEYARVLRSTP